MDKESKLQERQAKFFEVVQRKVDQMAELLKEKDRLNIPPAQVIGALMTKINNMDREAYNYMNPEEEEK